MYFNRKNAEQKNWRMIKKGKHFLFGCSLVFAVGASLATQVFQPQQLRIQKLQLNQKLRQI